MFDNLMRCVREIRPMYVQNKKRVSRQLLCRFSEAISALQLSFFAFLDRKKGNSSFGMNLINLF